MFKIDPFPLLERSGEDIDALYEATTRRLARVRMDEG
jgi:hypothetical protein